MPTSDHSTLGKPAGDNAQADAEPEQLGGEQLLAEAVNLVHALLAAILSDHQKCQQLLLMAIGDLDEDGLGLQHALEFLTCFRLKYVPTEGLAEGAVIQADVPPPAELELDDDALRDWQAANALVTKLWSARAHLRTNPTTEVLVRMSLRSASDSVRLLVLLVMAISVSEMMAYTMSVRHLAFVCLDRVRQQFAELNAPGRM